MHFGDHYHCLSGRARQACRALEMVILPMERSDAQSERSHYNKVVHLRGEVCRDLVPALPIASGHSPKFVPDVRSPVVGRKFAGRCHFNMGNRLQQWVDWGIPVCAWAACLNACSDYRPSGRTIHQRHRHINYWEAGIHEYSRAHFSARNILLRYHATDNPFAEVKAFPVVVA